MTGNELKEILKRNGFSSTEVAEKLGLSRQNFSNKIHKQDVKVGFLKSISEATGLPMSAFIQDFEPQSPASETQNGVFIPQKMVDMFRNLTETVKLQQETIATLVGVKTGDTSGGE